MILVRSTETANTRGDCFDHNLRRYSRAQKPQLAAIVQPTRKSPAWEMVPSADKSAERVPSTFAIPTTLYNFEACGSLLTNCLRLIMPTTESGSLSRLHPTPQILHPTSRRHAAMTQ